MSSLGRRRRKRERGEEKEWEREEEETIRAGELQPCNCQFQQINRGRGGKGG